MHNGPVSTRHIYVPEYAKHSAKYFNIPNVILIPNTFSGALDEATFCPWWSLKNILEEKFPKKDWDFGVEAFTVEMGSQEVIQFEAGIADSVSILTYLSYKKCFVKEQYSPKEMIRRAVYLQDYKTIFSQFGGMVEYVAEPGIAVKRGEILARVLNIDELDNARATFDVVAPCDLIPILHFPSASVFGGTQLYKCFTDYFEL